MFRTPAMRLAAGGAATRTITSCKIVRASQFQLRAASTAISNPTLKNIEKRWEGMPVQEQAELWMSLRDRMKVPWQELTLNEKKAAYWIAFGPHGPRAEPPPGEGKRVAMGTAIGVLVSFAIFLAIRMFAKPAPTTMTKEYQEESNELLKAQKTDPFTWIGHKDYKGPGMVQSAPKKPE